MVLLRSAQEAIANVRKHARATSARIDVTATDHEVVLTVTDDGIGPGDAQPGEHGFGLAGIRDRASLVGGTFEFGPGATGGARLRVRPGRAGIRILGVDGEGPFRVRFTAETPGPGGVVVELEE